MSAVYFHTQYETATLRGSERAYMGVLCHDLTVGLIGDFYHAKEWLAPLIPPGHDTLYNPSTTAYAVRLFFATYGNQLVIDGEQFPAWLLSLNTALAVGGDPLRLLARLHGQCEVHCWVDSANRRWLAGIIRKGLGSSVFRKQQGWENVVNLLESRDDCPVVCSYSVCSSFPNFDCLPDSHPLKLRADDTRFDEFDELPMEEAWRDCFAGLRAKAGGRELRPDGWEDFRFGKGHSIFTLRGCG